MKFVDVKNDVAFRKISGNADKHSWKERLIAYDNASIAEQDVRGKMTFMVNKTLKERNKEIIYSCLKENMTLDIIVRITGLPKEEIAQIIEEFKKS